MGISCLYSLLLFLVLISSTGRILSCLADPTDGFTEIPLTDRNFDLQKPYNVPLNDRYSYQNGVRRLWVYTNDKPFKPDTTTRPRTEVRIKGLDYSSGVWQFEGHAYVPKATSGVTVMQIHGARVGATSLQLRIYEDEGKITVFIDGVQKFVKNDQGPGDLYFKCGVYAAPANSSSYMESRWRDIKIYKK
ncbi:citrate-binding protein-like [Coffea arabica]|uniref:Citrate-binding protein-like n=1 Tax=Coffea arabica TaxID=13443 RepID=A0ABM4W0E7_COFAR